MSAGVAFVWDFDGTLADTRRRNFNVVRRLLSENTRRALDAIPALASAEAYDQVNRRFFNWRELYLREFGFDASIALPVENPGRACAMLATATNPMHFSGRDLRGPEIQREHELLRFED